MANPVADSLLAVIAGLVPAHVATASARGAENRQTQLGIISANQASSEKKAQRDQQQQEFQATQDYRGKVLEGQTQEAQAAAKFRADQLDLQKSEILDKSEFQRLKQDYENKSALLNLQIEGLRNELGLARQRGGTTPEDLYTKAFTSGLVDILKNPDITGTTDIIGPDGKKQRVSNLQYRVDFLKKQLDTVFPGVSGSGATGGANAQEIQSLIDSLNNPAGAPGTSVAPIDLGNLYQNSPTYNPQGFNSAVSDETIVRAITGGGVVLPPVLPQTSLRRPNLSVLH